jgi:5'-nucleotidase
VEKILKTILITNDDGFEAEGILALREALQPLGRVIVVAPSSEKSACSHSVTLNQPLKLVEVEKDFYKVVDGTPSDCIYISQNAIFSDFKPDIVISGINRGANMGEDITYSGTVAGAIEGILQGYPSISISQVLGKEDRDNVDYGVAQKVIYKVVKRFLDGENPLSEREILNINVPPNGDENLIEITYAGHRLYGNDTHIYYSPRGEKLYWLGLHPLQWQDREVDEKFRGYHSDFDAIFGGSISFTPIKVDLTAYEKIENLKKWL